MFEAATRNIFRVNAFRVVRLSVDATPREAAKNADRLKIMAELGGANGTNGGALTLKPEPTVDDIRDAIQKLKAPERRIIDEFFWFWPEEFGHSDSDAAIQALSKGDTRTAIDLWRAREKDRTLGIAAAHNLAIVYHTLALDWEIYGLEKSLTPDQRAKTTEYWKRALVRWERLAPDDHLWDIVGDRIRQLDEPNLQTGFARRMRATLPDAIFKISADLALILAENGKSLLAREQIQYMRETYRGLGDYQRAADSILKPEKMRLAQKIQFARERGAKSGADAARAARELIQQAQPSLAIFELFLGKNSEARNDLCDEIAGLCNELQVVYYKATGDNSTCLDLLRLVMPIVVSPEIEKQIGINIETLKGNLLFKSIEPILSLLATIQNSKASPSARLGRVRNEVVPSVTEKMSEHAGNVEVLNDLLDAVAALLRGISLEAWNVGKDTATALTASVLAQTYARGAEIKQRLIEDQATLQQIASRQRSKKYQGWAWLVGVGIVVILLLINSATNNSNKAASSGYSYNTASTPGPYATTQTAPATQNAEGTYSVPSSVSSELDEQRHAAEAEQSKANQLATQLDYLGREIERERTVLDQTDQAAIDAFNAKVARYNALVEPARTETQLAQKMVDDYNTRLRIYSR